MNSREYNSKLLKRINSSLIFKSDLGSDASTEVLEFIKKKEREVKQFEQGYDEFLNRKEG